MRKGLGKAQQMRGHKRANKQKVRKANKHAHAEFMLHLVLKYKEDFDPSKLKQIDLPGAKYTEWYLNA
jgi:hypothetical protein